MNSLQYKNRVYWLGYMGILPVMAATMLVWMDIFRIDALNMVHYYAALILTFIGAIHWGRSMQNAQVNQLTLSVVPSLYALVCLMLPTQIALPALMFGFIAIYLFDAKMYSNHPWFKVMRQRLTWLFSGLLLLNWLSLPAYG